VKSTRINVTVIPASGWSSVSPYKDADGTVKLCRVPVIGFLVQVFRRELGDQLQPGDRELFTVADPIFIDGDDNSALQFLDGPFSTVDETISGGDDALLAYFKAKQRGNLNKIDGTKTEAPRAAKNGSAAA
jgi:hypothetical protein